MSSEVPQNPSKIRGEEKTGWKLRQFLTKLLKVWGPPPAPGKQKGFAAPFLVEKEEKGACRHHGNVEKGPGGPRVVRNGDKRRNHQVSILAGMVVLLIVGLGVVAVRNMVPVPVPVRDCPYSWVGYRGVCYFLTEEEEGWRQSQEQCFSLGASLTVIKKEWEMEFLQRLRGKADYWVGLRREGERLVWVDGSDFNQTIPLAGRDDCYFLSDGHLRTSGCSRLLPYLCSKPQILPSPK